MAKKGLMKPIKGKGVELRQLVGRQVGSGKVVYQSLDLVCLDGLVVGRLGRASGAKLILTAETTEEERKKIHKGVTQARIAQGKWIPDQDFDSIVFPATQAELDEALRTDEKLDKELLEKAQANYGDFDEDAVANIDEDATVEVDEDTE